MIYFGSRFSGRDQLHLTLAGSERAIIRPRHNRRLPPIHQIVRLALTHRDMTEVHDLTAENSSVHKVDAV